MSRGAANFSGGSGDERPARSDSPKGEDRPAAPPPSSQAANELAGELLECVVRETLSAVNDEATVERMKTFARRNAAREVTDPEVAEELLRVIVQSRFGKLSLPSELPRWLAETLLDDPDASQRLQSLWNQARQAAP